MANSHLVDRRKRSSLGLRARPIRLRQQLTPAIGRTSCTITIGLHRPLKEARNAHVVGPPYDSAIFEYSRFDCDGTKGALRQFNEAQQLLISQRSDTKKVSNSIDR